MVGERISLSKATQVLSVKKLEYKGVNLTAALVEEVISAGFISKKDWISKRVAVLDIAHKSVLYL